ncbi:MAG: 50S ribosomal protein L23 [Fimbriimonas ginsengisoli]|uniref:Large ribosomal subunit protein uL23 n=1 Tax=Fimbriimonas ginsengisoli TaxID=1005039 RepID=A0A931PUY2_FIMGI|nr:50S ribosomal protein L23 [Fimbriimonas ginsengisoli]
MKNPHLVILKPLISEKTVALSYGDPRIREEERLVRKYSFLVAPEANKIEIRHAIEAIYNAGKKASDAIKVTSVRTINVHPKRKRRGMRVTGLTKERKKAIVTLARGQVLEDYGV